MIIKNIYKGETLIDNVYKGSETFFERIPNHLEFAPYGFELGSVGRASVDEIRSYTSSTAVSNEGHERVYSTYDLNNLIFVRNTSHWLANIDFSGVVVKKVGNPANRLPGDDPNAVLGGPGGIMATAITPNHVIAAHHYQFMTGDDLYFVDKNQNVIKRTIINKSPFTTGDTTPVLGDIIIHQLDEALPSTVKVYKLLPKNFLKYIPINSFENTVEGSFSNFKGIAGRGMPIICLSHYRWHTEWTLPRNNIYTFLLQIVTFNNEIHHSFCSSYYGIEQVKGQNYQAYDGWTSAGSTGSMIDLRYFPFLGGDSGGPMFLLINGELVCIGHHYALRYGYSHTWYFDHINYLLSRLPVNGNVLQLQTIDLSNYLSYPELGNFYTHSFIPSDLTSVPKISYEVYRGYTPYEDNNQCDVVLRRGRDFEMTAGVLWPTDASITQRIQSNPSVTETYSITNTALEIGTQLYTGTGETQISRRPNKKYTDRPGYYTIKPSIHTNWDIFSLKVNGSGIITEKSICNIHPSGDDDASQDTYALSGLQSGKHSNLPFEPWVIGSINSKAGITSSSGLSNTFNIDTNSKCWFLSGSGFSLPNAPFSLATCSRNTRFPLTTGTALSAVIAIGNDTNYERYVTFLNADNPQGPNFVTMTNFKFLTGSYYFGGTLLDSSGIGAVTDLAIWEIVAKQTAKKNTEITLTRRDLPLGGSGTAQNPQTKNFNGVLGAISFNLNGGSSNPSSWLYFNSLKTYKYSV